MSEGKGIKKMKKSIKIVLILIGIIIIYFMICTFATNKIIKKMKLVIDGKEIIQDMNDPWYQISFHKDLFPEVVEVQGNAHRVFTVCGINKGYMLVWFDLKYLNEKGETVFETKNDMMDVTIKRVDGEWQVEDITIKP